MAGWTVTAKLLLFNAAVTSAGDGGFAAETGGFKAASGGVALRASDWDVELVWGCFRLSVDGSVGVVFSSARIEFDVGSGAGLGVVGFTGDGFSGDGFNGIGPARHMTNPMPTSSPKNVLAPTVTVFPGPSGLLPTCTFATRVRRSTLCAAALHG